MNAVSQHLSTNTANRGCKDGIPSVYKNEAAYNYVLLGVSTQSCREVFESSVHRFTLDIDLLLPEENSTNIFFNHLKSKLWKQIKVFLGSMDC